jgi:cobalt-zinc-cadmium efflux system outer membrane protein
MAPRFHTAWLLTAGIAVLGCATGKPPLPLSTSPYTSATPVTAARTPQPTAAESQTEAIPPRNFQNQAATERVERLPAPEKSDRGVPERRQAQSIMPVDYQEPPNGSPQPPKELEPLHPDNPEEAEVVMNPPAEPSAPSEPGKFSLRQLTEIALQANPILERSLSDIDAAKGERVQAGLYKNPTFETNNPEIFAGQQSSVNFGFQQDIIVKGKMRMEKAAADQLVRRQTAEFQLDKSRMLMNIRAQYYQVIAAKQRFVLTKYLIKVAQQSVNAAKELQKGGEGSLTDVLLLENELQRAYTEFDQAKTMLEGELRQLSAVVGVRELMITDVEGTLFDQPPDFDEGSIREFVTNQSSYIERGQADILRSQTLLRREEVEAYPNLRMGPAYQAGTTPHTGQFWLSIIFDIPVWDLNQGNIRKAQAKVRNAAADMEVTRNELLQHTADVYSRYRSSKQIADRLRNVMLPNSQKTLQLVQEGFVKGQFDVNRLLQAQRNLSDISREHLEAAEKAWTTSAELSGLLQLENFGK